ncbi:hypothetical protein RHMOL_Rhmol13G0061800 [Rhododendron molle]|uniref:Uncharacterized protein n=1 Tax=Rhododendron molle TaxID=49168 RepID=A0ACC0L454_RHOML|nr:hypothetical protein RHMOL_Rhmol13G0061800 [Rhododendron molle]
MYLRQRNAQSLAHVHRITQRCRQIKPVDQTSKHQVNHLQTERNTGAHPSARAERNILELLPSEPEINTLAQKPLRFELVGLRPHLRVPLQLPQVHDQTGSLRDVVAADGAVFRGLAGSR